MLGFNRWHLLKMAAAILCVAGVVWLALVYLIPAPPRKIKIATSPQGDHYQVLGTRYQGILSGASIEIELQATDGAKENLRLLNDPNSGIQAGFMQGGLSNSRLSPDLLSLGRIDYQIFWLFYPTGETITDLIRLGCYRAPARLRATSRTRIAKAPAPNAMAPANKRAPIRAVSPDTKDTAARDSRSKEP